MIVTEFNIEGYPTDDFLKLVTQVKADQVTLVPDAPGQVTSDHGWDTITHRSFLTDVVARLKESGIRTSLFVDPDQTLVEGAAMTGTDRVELYTEPYATLYPADRMKAVKPFVDAARAATACGLGLNAGHDLSLENLKYLVQMIPEILEVSIGHALIADSLYFGLENTIQKYLDCLR